MKFTIVKGLARSPFVKDSKGTLTVLDTTDPKMFDLRLQFDWGVTYNFVTSRVNKSKLTPGGELNVHQGDPTRAIRIQVS